MRHDHGNGATMAGGFERGICHVVRKVKLEQSGTRRLKLGTENSSSNNSFERRILDYGGENLKATYRFLRIVCLLC